MKSTTKSIAYWMATGIAMSTMLRGGITPLLHPRETIDCTTQLGYQMYSVMNTGLRLLGSLELVAATVSHLVCPGAAWHVVVTLGLAALALASWAL